MNQQGTNFLADPATSNFRAEDACTLKMATAGLSKNSGTFPQIQLVSQPVTIILMFTVVRRANITGLSNTSYK
jgi:hypothetical protein